MSLYPSYANPVYPPNPGYPANQAYHGPPHRGPPVPALGPPGPNPLHVDPNAFRQFYASQLATLTFNSRPIIQNLSMMAQDFQRWAPVVVQCLEAHIRRVPPPIKLPAFYLLDSICKNIYNPYASVFTPIVQNLFLEAYRSVDPVTQAKMEEMLVTWRTGAPNGRELFGVAPQMTLEQSVWGGASAASPFQTAPSGVTRKQVLAELEVTLAHKERVLQSNPYDPTTAQQVDTLVQLRNLVQHSDVPPQDLVAIVDQLRTLSGPVQPQVIPVTTASAPVHYHTSNSAPVLPPSTIAPVSYTSTPVLTVPSAQSADVPDLSHLYNSLLKAGVLGQTSKVSEGTPPPRIDPAIEAEKQYEETVMAMDVASSSSNISRVRPAILSLLYKRLPSQCKQCALRYADDESGKKALQDHLDVHFRQNLRASQNTGRGHSRSWFVSLEDWTQEVAGDEFDKKVASEAKAERDSKLRSAYVVVPPGEEAKHVQCPVCKEFLKSEFNEDDEEWIWTNAVRFQDKIYHSTCHADAYANPLVARLKADSSFVSSRSRTPESALPSSPPTLSPNRVSASPEPSQRSLKRKAEDSIDVKHEDGTFPSKRLALSP